MNYKIYGLKLKNMDEIRYIGMTSKIIESRLDEHIKYTSKLKHKNANWIKKHKDNIEIILIEDNIDTKEGAFNKEIQYIKLFKSFGANLTNGTLGGEGNLTQETKDKISKSSKGRIQTQETKDKISKTTKGRKGFITRECIEVLVFDLDNNYITSYNSIRECGRELGLCSSHIGRCCKGERKRVGKYRFIYKNN